jgi:LysR family hydrogen peroxide-inducible transcriptional activator
LPVKTDGLIVEKLFSEPFYVALPKNHPLASKNKLNVRDLERETLLLLEEGHCLREQALEACRWAKTEGASEFSATSLETLRQIVGLGGGITLIPGLSIQSAKSDKNIVIRPFGGAIPSRDVGMLWRQSSVAEICCRSVAHLIKQQIKLCAEVNIGVKTTSMTDLLG